MRPITEKLIQDTINQAKASPRKRAHFLFHQHPDPVQRIINAVIPGTYIPPHRHKNPDKIETFVILKGKIAALEFDKTGNIKHVYLLELGGQVKGVDIRPGVYHGFIALEPSAMLEIIQGPYNKDTHKDWPSWAPPENTPEADEYLKSLELQVQQLITKQRKR